MISRNLQPSTIILNTIVKHIKYCVKIVATILIINAPISTHAQTLIPEINNYSFASNQNWDIDVSDDHMIYVANHAGLSTYNGQSWTLFELPEKMIIRSVLSDGDRIYTGSYEEFGFWKKDEFGQLAYHSLKSKFKEGFTESEEFWQILKFNEQIIFRSFGALYIYDGEIIERISKDFDISSLTVYDNKLLIGSLSDGLFQLKGKDIVPYNFSNASQKITSVSHIAAHENSLIIYNPTQGVYLYTEDTLQLLPEKINNSLSDFVLNKIQPIDHNTIAFGTIKNGIILYKIKSNTLQILNKEAGLKNNTVLGLSANKDHLWIALDNGISRIDLKSEFVYYYDKTGQLGTVYDITFFHNQYYLASNTGIYTFKNNQLELIENSEGHSWEFFIHNDTLFCAHNNGTYILDKNKLVLINGSFSGVYSYLPMHNFILQSTYSGIGAITCKDKTLLVERLEGMHIPIDKIVNQNDHILWATHPYSGLYRLHFDSTTPQIKKVDNFSENATIERNKVVLQKIANTVYFVIDAKWYTFQDESESFELFTTLNNKKLIGKNDDELWFIDEKNPSVLLSYTSDFKEKYQVKNDKLFALSVKGYEKLVSVNDSTKLINLNDGFAVLHQNKIQQKSFIKPTINFITSNARPFKTENDSVLKLTYQQAKSIYLNVHTPGSFNNSLVYNLEGITNQTGDITKGSLTLKNLSAGNYLLTIFEKGSPELNKTLHIEVLPPWYLSTLMKIFYVLLLLASFYFLNQYQKKKAKKEQAALEKNLNDEAKQQLQLAEKNNLIKEVKIKKRELSNTTASVIQKNETIILLINELNRLLKSSPDLARTKHVIHTSKKQLDNQKDWQLFESNFNDLNEDFFKSLTKAFPKMTSKDLKLCAYIKIGLTSKEIAPLMGITTRGVELHRYRLRRKLKFDSNISFNEFLRQY